MYITNYLGYSTDTSTLASPVPNVPATVEKLLSFFSTPMPPDIDTCITHYGFGSGPWLRSEHEGPGIIPRALGGGEAARLTLNVSFGPPLCLQPDMLTSSQSIRHCWKVYSHQTLSYCHVHVHTPWVGFVSDFGARIIVIYKVLCMNRKRPTQNDTKTGGVCVYALLCTYLCM